MGNTEEFIGLYHKLWDHLRQITDSGHDVSFTKLIDKVKEVNGLVRSEARSLKDFARLGNAIKNHQGYPIEKIAEPTKEALSKFKYLVDSIISPKDLIPAYQCELRCFAPDEQLVNALRYMKDNDFSQIVVQNGGKLALLTVEGVAKWFGQQAEKETISVAEVQVRDALSCDISDTYVVMGPENTIYDAQEAFSKAIETKHPRLFAILITDTGDRSGKPIGIVTPWDLTPEEPRPSDYVFRREGNFWNITFEREHIILKYAKGLHYIMYLLQKPRENIHVSTLQTAVEGTQAGPAAKLYNGMSAEQLEEYGLSISRGLGDAGTILDTKSISIYKEQYQSHMEELEEAERFNDPVRADQLREQIEIIKEQLATALGLGGRVRKSADSRERVRKAVTNRIKDSLKKIKKEHRSLGLHLSKAIETGTLCSYKPEKPIRWNF